MKNLCLVVLVFLSAAANSTAVFAADLSWSGLYRVEADLVRNSTLLGSNQPQKDYLVHHLILRPQIIAADGITIRSRFDLFNGSNKSSQLGQVFGSNFGSNGLADANSSATGTMNSETLQVNELYLTWVQGFGSFVAGRTPVQFGLGITHSAGNDEFDHWYEVKDVVGYKVVLGNFYFLPMIGKIREDNLDKDDDVNEVMAEVMYENLDTDLTLGVFYEDKTSAINGGDLNLTTNPYFTTAGVVVSDPLDIKDINIFVKKKIGNLSIGFETGYQTGYTGLKTATGETVNIEGFAFVGEVKYTPPDSNFAWKLKLGSVSGNDPNTTKYEGYLLNRNYDVGMLMFNYGLGQGDILGTNGFKSLTNSTTTDVEYVSNALYIAPSVNWKWGERWAMDGTLVYATLNRAQTATQSKNLGFEADIGITHKPHEHLTWRTQLGVLAPGDAWKGGANNFDSTTAYGLMTKIAVSF